MEEQRVSPQVLAMLKRIKMSLPKVIHEAKVTIGSIEITVCILEDGRRIISAEDMKKALTVLGLSEEEISQILNTK